MLELLFDEHCAGCYSCQSVCPKKCISLTCDNRGYRYPIIDKDACVNCHLCEKVCPLRHDREENGECKAYAAFCKDEADRVESSSGGIFSLISRAVIQNGGCTVGAVYTDSFQVKHVVVTDDISKLRGSKYLQSEVDFIYMEVKELLKADERVLFSGTPCQVAGLKSYLQIEYENLITVDVACHGVPSAVIWNKYLDYLTKKYKSKIASINLRDKSTGWKGYSVSVAFQNGKKYTKLAEDDPFMKLYRSNLCLRPSCYNCKFRGLNRVSDITLADFWGADRIIPEMDDDKGLSLVLTHSQKGEEIIRTLQSNACIKKLDVACAVSGNPALTTAIPIPKQCEEFHKDISNMDVIKLTRKYCKHSVTIYDIKVRTARLLNIRNKRER